MRSEFSSLIEIQEAPKSSDRRGSNRCGRKSWLTIRLVRLVKIRLIPLVGLPRGSWNRACCLANKITLICRYERCAGLFRASLDLAYVESRGLACVTRSINRTTMTRMGHSSRIYAMYARRTYSDLIWVMNVTGNGTYHFWTTTLALVMERLTITDRKGGLRDSSFAFWIWNPKVDLYVPRDMKYKFRRSWSLALELVCDKFYYTMFLFIGVAFFLYYLIIRLESFTL